MKKHYSHRHAATAATSLLLLVAACLIGLGGAFAAQASADSRYDLVYFDGHMHTVESDGSGTMTNIKTEALENGLDAVIVTNHAEMLTVDEWASLNRQARRLSDRRFLVINSFEVTGSEGMFNRDHVLAWGVTDPFVGRDPDELTPSEVWRSPFNPNGNGTLSPASIARWVDYIHRQGGVAVHAHTTGTTDPAYGVDCIELFNLSHVKDVASYASQLGLPAAQAWSLGLTFNNMAVYGERDLGMMVTLPGIPTPLPLRTALYAATKQMTGLGQIIGGPEAPLHSWDDSLMGYVRGEIDHPTWGVAESDAHNTANVGAGTYTDDSDVGEARNGVFVRRLTRDSLLDAMRAGHSFATTGPSMEFTVDGKQMGETAKMMLTRRSARAELELSVDAESPGAVIAKVTLVKNGEVLLTLSPMSPSFDRTLCDYVDEDGYYRVEVVSVDPTSGQYQFAYSNPVFVEIAGRSCGR